MKILMLVPFLPNISTSGGQTRWFNILKYLSKDHDITLYSLIKDNSEKKFIPPLKKYCKNVRVFKRPKSPWTLRNIILTGFSWYPLLVIRNYSYEEKKAIKTELERGDYDLIHAETFYVMPHIPHSEIPSILVEQTIEYQVYMHYVLNEAPLLLKPLLMIDVLKLKFWEKYFWKKADKLVAVSEEDRNVMLKLIPGIKVGIIPNGVDSDYYTSKKVTRKRPPRVLYGVTNYEWLQNVEAVNVLIDKIWPNIRRKYPKAKVWIVGRKIPERIVKLGHTRQDIEVTESIKDSRDAYSASTLMVTPIRGSGGTRLKILEAMASGLPIVSTSIGVAGLKLKNGLHAMISDNINELIDASIKLLSNEILARKIGKAGQAHVKKHFDWQQIVKLHDEIYEEALIKK